MYFTFVDICILPYYVNIPPPPSPAEISSTARMKYTSRSRERTRGMTLFPGLLIWIKLRLSGEDKNLRHATHKSKLSRKPNRGGLFRKAQFNCTKLSLLPPPPFARSCFLSSRRIEGGRRRRRRREGEVILSIALDVSNDVWNRAIVHDLSSSFLTRREIKEITGEQRNGVLNGVSRRTVDDPLLLAPLLPPHTSFPLIR